MPGQLWGAIAQWSEHLQLKQEALGSIPGDCPRIFSLSAGLPRVDPVGVLRVL